MNNEQNQFLSLLGQPPIRLTGEQVAWIMNCAVHDIPILVAAGLLKPLGHPAPNAQKYFAAHQVLELSRNQAWLDQATDAILRHWRRKNRQRVNSVNSFD